MHHVDTIELSCSTTVRYIPHTMIEIRLVETQPLPHNRMQTVRQLQYNSPQKITYDCADSITGIRQETIFYIILT